MFDETDLIELAHELAEIASTTFDAETGLRLMQAVHRLMTEAGLPPDSDMQTVTVSSAWSARQRVCIH